MACDVRHGTLSCDVLQVIFGSMRHTALAFFKILHFKREKLSYHSWPRDRAPVPVAIDFNAGAPVSGKCLMRALVAAG